MAQEGAAGRVARDEEDLQMQPDTGVAVGDEEDILDAIREIRHLHPSLTNIIDIIFQADIGHDFGRELDGEPKNSFVDIISNLSDTEAKKRIFNAFIKKGLFNFSTDRLDDTADLTKVVVGIPDMDHGRSLLKNILERMSDTYSLYPGGLEGLTLEDAITLLKIAAAIHSDGDGNKIDQILKILFGKTTKPEEFYSKCKPLVVSPIILDCKISYKKGVAVVRKQITFDRADGADSIPVLSLQVRKDNEPDTEYEKKTLYKGIKINDPILCQLSSVASLCCVIRSVDRIGESRTPSSSSSTSTRLTGIRAVLQAAKGLSETISFLTDETDDTKEALNKIITDNYARRGQKNTLGVPGATEEERPRELGTKTINILPHLREYILAFINSRTPLEDAILFCSAVKSSGDITKSMLTKSLSDIIPGDVAFITGDQIAFMVNMLLLPPVLTSLAPAVESSSVAMVAPPPSSSSSSASAAASSSVSSEYLDGILHLPYIESDGRCLIAGVELKKGSEFRDTIHKAILLAKELAKYKFHKYLPPTKELNGRQKEQHRKLMNGIYNLLHFIIFKERGDRVSLDSIYRVFNEIYKVSSDNEMVRVGIITSLNTNEGYFSRLKEGLKKYKKIIDSDDDFPVPVAKITMIINACEQGEILTDLEKGLFSPAPAPATPALAPAVPALAPAASAAPASASAAPASDAPALLGIINSGSKRGRSEEELTNEPESKSPKPASPNVLCSVYASPGNMQNYGMQRGAIVDSDSGVFRKSVGGITPKEDLESLKKYLNIKSGWVDESYIPILRQIREHFKEEDRVPTFTDADKKIFMRIIPAYALWILQGGVGVILGRDLPESDSAAAAAASASGSSRSSRSSTARFTRRKYKHKRKTKKFNRINTFGLNKRKTKKRYNR